MSFLNTEEPTELNPLREEFTEVEVKQSSSGKLRTLFKNISVEPTVLLITFPTVLSLLTSQNLNLEKACRVNLNYTTEICDSLKLQTIEGPSTYEADLQKLVAKYLGYKTMITATLPSIMALLVGSWSDRSGLRKTILLIPIVGQLLVCINNIINAYFFYELRMEVLVFSEGIIEALTGGFCVAFCISFSYISAITTNEDRTYRMGLLNFCMTIGLPIGMGLSGIWLKKFGYFGCYGLAAVTHIINIIYTSLCLKDAPRTKEQIEYSKRSFLSTFFNLDNLKETLRVVFKKGPNNRRLRISVLLSVVTLLFGPMYGEISVLYLSTRYRFNWDEVKFSIFQTYNFATHIAGTMFSILYFSKYLKWHDAILGIISTVSKILGSFFYCFAPNETIFYIAPLVEILNGTSLLAIRSIISKVVNHDEVGKVTSLFGLVENLMPLIYVPLYTRTYTATMDILPGFVFLMGAVMTLPAVLVFIWLFYVHRKELRRAKDQEKSNTD